MKEIIRRRWLSVFLFLLMCMAVIHFGAADVDAASVGKPSIDSHSAYLNDTIYLKWSKAKGAKKYEIQRAKVNPKKKFGQGAWKKWTTTSNTEIRKKGSGDYMYRVRGINGGKKGSWSGAKRIFGASAYITTVSYYKQPYPLNWIYNDRLYFRLLINNKTGSDMGFVTSGTRYGPQGTIYALNPASGQIVKDWKAYLYIAESNGVAKTVKAGKEQSIYCYCEITEDDYNACKDCKFMVAFSFYPNPYVEPLGNQMALGCTNNVRESAIACKGKMNKK